MFDEAELIEVIESGDVVTLATAINDEDIDGALSLIQEGADVTLADQDGTTPILLAAKRGLFSLIPDLVQAGASATVPDAWGNTPLHLLANMPPEMYLVQLACGDLKEAVQALIDGGANVAAINAQGKTAFTIASETEKLQLAKQLGKLLRELKPSTISTDNEPLAVQVSEVPKSSVAAHVTRTTICGLYTHENQQPQQSIVPRTLART